MDDYISKPVKLGSLGATLQRLLRLNEARRDMQQSSDASRNVDLEPVIDEAVLPDMFEGDLTMAAEFRQRFMGRLDREMQGLCLAAEHAEWTHLGALAHRLKSSCRIVGAMRMAHTCEAIETGIASLPGDHLHTLVRTLRDQAADLKKHLQILGALSGPKN